MNEYFMEAEGLANSHSRWIRIWGEVKPPNPDFQQGRAQITKGFQSAPYMEFQLDRRGGGQDRFQRPSAEPVQATASLSLPGVTKITPDLPIERQYSPKKD